MATASCQAYVWIFFRGKPTSETIVNTLQFLNLNHPTHKTNHYVVFLRRKAMMKNVKLLCLFLVILFVSTEGGRGGRRGGGGEGGGLSATEVIIIYVVISVAGIVISCICYACQSDDCNCKNCEDYEEDNISNIYENRFVTNEYDQQPMRSSQIPQGNSLQRPDSTNLAVTES